MRTEIKEIVQKTNKILPSKIQITSLIVALGAALHLLAFGNFEKGPNEKADINMEKNESGQGKGEIGCSFKCCPAGLHSVHITIEERE